MDSIYSTISQRLQAMDNCKKMGNEEWEVKHNEAIDQLIVDHFPHGSGFDNGTDMDYDVSKPDRLVFTADYHHMDEHGYYCGWSYHTVIVTPSLAHGYNLRVTGRDMRGIKDYIADCFSL